MACGDFPPPQLNSPYHYENIRHSSHSRRWSHTEQLQVLPLRSEESGLRGGLHEALLRQKGRRLQELQALALNPTVVCFPKAWGNPLQAFFVTAATRLSASCRMVCADWHLDIKDAPGVQV